jgi:membrane AbrB-like protein
VTPKLSWIEAAITLVIGVAGAGLFWLIGFPMPFITGPATAVSVAAIAGVSVAIPTPLSDTCFLLLGLNIGAGVTPEVIATAAEWPISLLLLAILLVISMKLCTAILARGFGFDPTSAFLAATPGHLSYVLSLSTERSLPLDRIAVVQSTRVLLLSIMLPLVLVILGFDVTEIVPTMDEMTALHLCVLLVISFLVGLVFMRLHIPAAFLLAAMVVSAVGHGSGITPGAPTPALTTLAFVTMGSLIGTRFRGTSIAALRSDALAGITVTLVASLIMLVGALGLGVAAGFDPLLLFVAYAPGGVETMAAISVQLNLAAAVVAANHVVRLLLLSVLVPILMPKD